MVGVFIVSDARRSNLAAMIHAGWKNQGEVGLNLLESTEFDERNSVLRKAQLSQLSYRKWILGKTKSQPNKRKTKRNKY